MKAARWLLPRLFLSLGMIAILLAGAEWAFTRYIVLSDALAMTRMHQRWVEKYWYPENSLMYRDTEWTSENLRNKISILVVGDSFPSGHGINYIKDRFPNVLNQKLGENYAVMLAAQPGYDTDKEIIALRTYPHPANALVFSYFLNDIVPACKKVAGVDPYLELGNIRPSPSLQTWLNHSNVLDYLYWSIYIRQTLADNTRSTMDVISSCYLDSKVWGYHSAQLQTIYNWAYLQGVPLVVVVFPHLLDPSLVSQSVTNVEAFFTSRDIPVINQTAIWTEYPVQDRVANHLDWHPSIKLHHEIGELLAEEPSLQNPTVQPFAPAIDHLLLPVVYTEFQVTYKSFIPEDAPIYMPGTDYRDYFLNFAEAANFGFYLKSERQTDLYQLVGIADQIITEKQLSPAQEANLKNWRASKSGIDLHQAGFDYLLVSRLWLGWLNEAEYNALNSDYEVVRRWEFPEYETEYQLLRAK